MSDNIKIFEVWRRITRYIMLKCPECKKIFRRSLDWNGYLKLNGKNLQNVTCIKCDNFFPIENNIIDEDNISTLKRR